ncbi:hypothetical protein K0T92_07350 [Paenibacillus oenotherae]|uniref:Uncharacterized protein n=1 Tax=Paenibacillus oenotherae TaxID=1435645 RepID=A0ABS7D3Q4_9BACL|nr:hypothetical protein [Paenibacillus oenotherae]MBW7474557.1 hypothetical protein [Paenibacillus oenotherae]
MNQLSKGMYYYEYTPGAGYVLTSGKVDDWLTSTEKSQIDWSTILPQQPKKQNILKKFVNIINEISGYNVIKTVTDPNSSSTEIFLAGFSLLPFQDDPKGSKSKSKSGVVKNVLKESEKVGDNTIKSTLEDGTLVIFKNVHSHPIGPEYPQSVLHYGIQLFTPSGGGRYIQVKNGNFHVTVDSNGKVIDIITK